VIGFIEGAIGLSSQTISISSFIASLPVGLAWGLVVVRMALKKKYIDFRLILVPKIPN
jgi:hypothetical protein